MKSKNTMMSAIAIAMCAGMAAPAFAGSPTGSQCALRINEVLVNPKTSDDDLWEFVEIFGEPNTSLSGMAIVFVNDDGSTTEVDESFIFPSGDLYRTNSSGYFVLWNSSEDDLDPDVCADGNSDIWAALPSSVTQDLDPSSFELSGASVRFEACFKEVGTFGDRGDWPAKLSNDGSVSILLLNTWTSDADIAKDASVTDTTTAGTPDFTTNAGITDAVAWSDNGDEFAGREGREIDYTPSFKPDALTRVDDIELEAVYGDRYINGTEEFRDSYTNWVYGDITSNSTFAFDGSKAKGGVDNPGSGNTASQPTVNISMTPGLQNASFNGRGGSAVSPSCITMLIGPDLDGNGVINHLDLMAAMRQGRTDLARKILLEIE